MANPLAPRELPRSITGDIDESGDLFARGRLRPCDLLAFFPAGAYGASMASDHGLRGAPAETKA